MLKVIQITDTHILDDDESLFNDFDTSASLGAVIEAIKNNEPDADVILLTGDLVHEPTDTAYQNLADQLAGFTAPLFYLPGNHDDRTRMDYVLGNNGFDQCNLVLAGDWALVLLDTHVNGEQGGELSQAELAFLQQCLETYPEHHVLVALHHHPVPIDSPWMDGMALGNAEQLFDILDRFQRVKAVIWGHIHQAYEDWRQHYALLGTPSTCLQFKPRAEKFTLDDKTPAYRRLVLKGEGGLESAVEYIDYEMDQA